MLFRVHSAAVFGIKAYPIAVEVDLSTGQKLNLMTVGLPDTAVRESSERVKAALRNCGYILPPSANHDQSRARRREEGRIGVRPPDGHRDPGCGGFRPDARSRAISLSG